MARARNYQDMSDLEREIELEMDDELESADAAELDDQELDDQELENGDGQRWELEGTSGADEEAGDEELELEADDAQEFETNGADHEYVERFLEIASRQYESESEVDQAMNEALEGIATEYFFGSLVKKARRLGSRLAKNPAIRALVSKGLKVASGQFPALKAALQLAKGDLKGSLLNLGKQALGAAIPGGPAALGALKTLGFGEAGPEADREGWENYVQLSREAFEHMAGNVTANADQPLEASRLATNAYRHAMQRAMNRARTGAVGGRRAPGGLRRRRGAVIRLRPGQRIVITGAARLIVRGA